MRHALRTRFRDSTARFLSLTPSFRRKERKMPANFCFGLRRSCPPAQLFFSQLLIVFEDRIFYRRTTRISVTLASSISWENFRNIIFLLLHSFGITCFFHNHVARCRHVLLRDFFMIFIFPCFLCLPPSFQSIIHVREKMSMKYMKNTLRQKRWYYPC